MRHFSSILLRAMRPALLVLGLAMPAQAFTLSPYPLPQVGGQELPLILAQQTGGCEGNYCGNDDDAPDRADPSLPPPPPGTPADAIGISPEATAQIVARIKASNRYCQDHYEPGYIIDCVARAYEQIGRSLPYRSGYGGMRNALAQSGAKLHEWAIANTDPTKEGIVGRSSKNGPKAYLRPVKRTPKANAEAAAIIEEAQVVLLRSASGSDQRRVAYEQVANVVGSSVVLLRSGRRKRRKADAGGLQPNPL